MMEKLIYARGFKDEGDRDPSQGRGGRLSPSNVYWEPEFALSPSLVDSNRTVLYFGPQQ
jgi:hypothetical protein